VKGRHQKYTDEGSPVWQDVAPAVYSLMTSRSVIVRALIKSASSRDASGLVFVKCRNSLPWKQPRRCSGSDWE
jgi:hypothetical protein